jgi:ribonuclease HI
MVVEIYQDGACDNKLKKIRGIGVWCIVKDNEGVEVETREVFLNAGNGTSNEAEWIACCVTMKLIEDFIKPKYPRAVIRVYSDSQLITNQFNEDWNINEFSLRQFYIKAKEIAEKASFNGRISWIRRELNTKADELSKAGLQMPAKTFEQIMNKNFVN